MAKKCYKSNMYFFSSLAPFISERPSTAAPFVQTTTESLLQSLLHQIEEEKRNSPPGTEPLIFR